MRLMDRIRRWFGYETLTIVERPPISPLKEDPEVLATLGQHAGFLMLLDRLKKERAIIQGKLHSNNFVSLREVDSLQASLYWLSYLENTIRQAAKMKVPTYALPDEDLRESFNRIKGSFESV